MLDIPAARRNNTRRLHDHDSAMSLFTAAAARGVELWFFPLAGRCSPYKEGTVRANLDIPHLVLCMWVCVLKFTCVHIWSLVRSQGPICWAFTWMCRASRVMDICARWNIQRASLSRGHSATKSASHHPDIRFKANTPIKHLCRAILYRAPLHTHKAEGLFCEMFMSVRDCCWRHC